MGWVEIAAVYISGMVSGLVAAMFVIAYYGNKWNKQSKAKKEDPIAERMNRIKDITIEQMDLQGQASGPQKNALHGKYKNGLNAQLKILEEEKTTILKSIIADGFDPEISFMDGDGEISRIKLSEFLAQTGVIMDPKVPAVKEEPKVKQVGKFTVHKGGKDDGTNH